MSTPDTSPFGPFEVSPEPTADELAAIALAVEQLWPKPAEPRPAVVPIWKMASRPWIGRARYGGWR